MLDVILQILSVLGTILLVLLILVIILLALVLFFPITYRFEGAKQEEFVLNVKANWLFGLVRVRFGYPEPACLTVKALWLTIYKKFFPGDEGTTEDKQMEDVVSKRQKKKRDNSKTGTAEKDAPENHSKPKENIVSEVTTNHSEKVEETVQNSFFEKILKKIEQIKYTILSICDKIKEIWENINYYAELLRDENTKKLFQHITLRVGKILKNIRPRHLKADIVFGTGSPDTTGYAYAVYGMFSTVLGSEFIVTPDFEQAVLKGKLQVSGHITIWVLLINALKLFFDPKLHQFIEKVKAGLPAKTADKK